MITCFCGNFDKNSQQKTVKNQRSLLEMPLWFFNTVIGRNPGKILNVNALLTSAEAMKRNVLTIRQAVISGRKRLILIFFLLRFVRNLQ